MTRDAVPLTCGYWRREMARSADDRDSPPRDERARRRLEERRAIEDDDDPPCGSCAACRDAVEGPQPEPLEEEDGD